MNEPKVSVVITAHNRPDYLRAALKTVLDQTYRNTEIIVVDDASQIDLAGVAGSFPHEIRYVRQSENGGPSRARNRGVALAGGDYVAFLDDDDEWLADKLNAQVAAMEGHLACLCGFIFLEHGANQVHNIKHVNEDLLRLGNIFCGASGFMGRKDALLACPFDDNLSSGEDWDVYVRLSQRGSIAYVPEPLFRYRLGSHESITTKARTMQISDIGVRLEHIRKNRIWLGERQYRILLARKILEYIGSKKGKLYYLLYSVREAGFSATLKILFDKVTRSREKLTQSQ